jgi:hypothetical protein
VAHNATHLHYQQVSVTSRGVIDELWIVSEQHGSFRNRTAAAAAAAAAAGGGGGGALS